MPLENLLTLIEKLQKRIDSHSDALRQSEALTRYALIDPLLRELGWDTEDPDVVVPEYRSDGGRPDYALHKEDKPIIMLEAKRLDMPLKDAVKQVINYCMHDGTEYSAVTDGRRWEIYETHKPVPIDEKRIISFDLKAPSVVDVCLKALTLWKPSVISGQIAVGETPVIGLPDDRRDTTETQSAEETTVQPTSPISDEDGWLPLSEFNPERETQFPTKIMFPDDSRASFKYQYEMLTKIMCWLMKKGHLDENQCPIRRGDTKHLLVDIKPMNSAGGEGSESCVKPVGSLYIDTWGIKKAKAKNARTIIQHVNQSPAQFKVRLP